MTGQTLKRYSERDKTRLEHTWEIVKAFGLNDFASAEAELAGKVRAHAWNTGDGPTALFQMPITSTPPEIRWRGRVGEFRHRVRDVLVLRAV
ncbi:DUF4158 domain-containing protein [Nonomuraea sp. NPDC049480]|uniref:DUF4158 domain-containing protein n=1 Tax=Nonomuraea sp. NPDC049480 TaxID=3364353 RepID=UPI0037BB3198